MIILVTILVNQIQHVTRQLVIQVTILVNLILQETQLLLLPAFIQVTILVTSLVIILMPMVQIQQQFILAISRVTTSMLMVLRQLAAM